MTRARDVADTQDNLGGSVPPSVAGKNKIINGAFDVWQRGTSFSGVATGVYTADRWQTGHDGNGTATVSQQTFTPGTAPVAGYESAYFLRHQIATTGSSTFFQIAQKIEDVKTFANQTVTLSFWAKSNANQTAAFYAEQTFGSGGSSLVLATYQNFSATTSWQRFTLTFTMPSISGKTIGTNSYIYCSFRQGVTTVGSQLDIWGVQLEAGSVATPFTTATGTIQGELAACQRYYYRQGGDKIYQKLAQGVANNTTGLNFNTIFPVTMRTTPTSVDFSTITAVDTVNAGLALSNFALVSNESSVNNGFTSCTCTGATQYRTYFLQTNNSTSGYLGFSAEL